MLHAEQRRALVCYVANWNNFEVMCCVEGGGSSSGYKFRMKSVFENVAPIYKISQGSRVIVIDLF